VAQAVVRAAVRRAGVVVPARAVALAALGQRVAGWEEAQAAAHLALAEPGELVVEAPPGP
jgi:hypothetical protein